MAMTGALVMSSCGSSKTGSASNSASTAAKIPAAATVPVATGKPLTRAQLIAQGDAICANAKAKIKTLVGNTKAEIINLLPQGAIYYNAEAENLSKLVPPASLSRDWKKIVDDIESVSQYTNGTARYAKEKQEKTAARFYKQSLKAREQALIIAAHDGFKNCSVAR
jgi:hypothetical protein